MTAPTASPTRRTLIVPVQKETSPKPKWSWGPALQTSVGTVSRWDNFGNSALGAQFGITPGLFFKGSKWWFVRGNIPLTLTFLEKPLFEPYNSGKQDPYLNIGGGNTWGLRFSDNLSLQTFYSAGFLFENGLKKPSSTGYHLEAGLGACFLNDTLCNNLIYQYDEYLFPVDRSAASPNFPEDPRIRGKGYTHSLGIQVALNWDQLLGWRFGGSKEKI